ncbi:hypothetical protein ymoll0001_38970 [Yersinia mollaretii ATCC 43969]|uniref:Uncharacterized protein n=1 Tax=Yersinia mollaretii (strain ATCC 43969 / DSM 18520 / CIP 103324 / CNY 7263 / WAIP 204) TaxID=349967 RepID=A0ABM9Y5W4_YERMW|nr:hypothetical protein ymoll0001_38970 [Yersinia mollaretii ATCC 43969]
MLANELHNLLQHGGKNSRKLGDNIQGHRVYLRDAANTANMQALLQKLRAVSGTFVA